MAPPRAVAVSAPGKVLLAGGYLVLDRQYTGLVFGLDARIHCVVQPIPTRNGVVLSEIEVSSPQFARAVWEYGYRWMEEDGGMSVTQLRVDAHLRLNRNPFVETALGYVLTYVASVSSPRLSPATIKILADNDYYSTSADMLSKSSPRFHNFGVPLSEAHKTGLGSSAALVTSLTAAVLAYYLPRSTFDLSTAESQTRLHNLAQAAHSAAQGKVGSGFDVASAVYGSCLYRRFSPRILAARGDETFGAPGFSASLAQLIEAGSPANRWDTEIHRDAVRVPPGLRLVMCDVDCGSATPGMVKKVLAWRAANPADADALWADLHHANESLAHELAALAASPALGSERLRACFARIRRGIRRMSELSGVPIEPPSQTELLDACEALPGVVGGVVPGAGGYDAIALLIEDREETVEALRELFQGWKFQDEKGNVGGTVSMLRVRQEMQGVREEEVEAYREYL